MQCLTTVIKKEENGDMSLGLPIENFVILTVTRLVTNS